ncbi:MAG: hypothetical protein HFI33_06880 [Lachnospiraceae bacterium]|nr:hypothetical protein [Lachnospiraceae bacterium]
MDYQKSTNLLPKELIEQIQKYVDGKVIYIPKKQINKKHWGENTDTKQILASRNCQICLDRQNGMTITQLSEKYFLTEKSIQRILRQEKM